LYARAISYYGLNKWKESLSDVEAAIRSKRRPKYLDTRAVLYKESQKFKEAIDDFTESLQLGGDSSEVYLKRAECYLLAGDEKKAIEDLTAAIKSEKSPDVNWYFWRAKLNKKLQNFEGALSDINFVIGKLPHEISLYLLRAETYYDYAKHTECVADTTKFIELVQEREDEAIAAPGNNAADLAQAYLLRSLGYVNLRNHNAAIKDITTALNLDEQYKCLDTKKRAEVLVLRGRLYLNKGKVKAAMKDFELAVKIYPDVMNLLKQIQNSVKEETKVVVVDSEHIKIGVALALGAGWLLYSLR
jgi:tetratricopeptide (TPR) repeat protein